MKTREEVRGTVQNQFFGNCTNSMDSFKEALLQLRAKEDMFRATIKSAGGDLPLSTGLDAPCPGSSCPGNTLHGSAVQKGKTRHTCQANRGIWEPKAEVALLSRRDPGGCHGIHLEAWGTGQGPQHRCSREQGAQRKLCSPFVTSYSGLA